MDVFSSFKSVVKLRDVLVDNEVFQLHYRVTALLLLGCAGLVASKQHFGDPIDCMTRDDVPPKLLDTYCWIHSTFTLAQACNKTVGLEVAHPCVDKSGPDREDRVYHKYYQWVYFVLFFQAMAFYAPHFLWKVWESRLLQSLTANLRDPLKDPIKDRPEGRARDGSDKFDLMSRFVLRNERRNRRYFRWFMVFEAANLANVIGQMYVVDAFLGGTFTSYGLEVLSYAQLEQDERVDPMVRVFPRMTKCTFHRYGASGDVQRHDALCILPLNIINEKIYIIMWFWFLFLALVTAGWLVYRLLTLLRPGLRRYVIQRRANFTHPASLAFVLDQLHTGDWFLLSMMCKNMDPQWFRLFIDQLDEDIHLELNRARPPRVRQPRAPAFRDLRRKGSLYERRNERHDDDDDDMQQLYEPRGQRAKSRSHVVQLPAAAPAAGSQQQQAHDSQSESPSESDGEQPPVVQASRARSPRPQPAPRDPRPGRA